MGIDNGTFDMAVMDGERIGLVEVNPAANFGCYAMDLVPVARAVVARVLGM